jgi:pimeloyl-ACP methyl ester carboxylesterase
MIMHTVTSKDGTKIAYDKRGEGPALIFVGGAFQYRAVDPATARLAELLAKDFTTYHYDRRGRGDSDDTPPYSTDREIEDLQALIIAAGGTAYVYAMSSGCALALDAAAKNLGIAKLTLYEPPFVVDDTRPPLPRNYIKHLDELVTAGRRGDAVEYAMTNAALIPHEMVAGMRQSPIWPSFEAIAHTIAYDGAFVADLMQGTALPAKRWSTVTARVLVMAGGASPAWLTNAAHALAQTLPLARYRVLDDQAHDVKPEAVAPIVTKFLRDQD